jgi:hypothetical protein
MLVVELRLALPREASISNIDNDFNGPLGLVSLCLKNIFHFFNINFGGVITHC